ncbi:hypothetical protein [Brevibacillus laterosporus]|uniref:hypothetical protein n=1 Tax=Brevibacillus laterosporus TaxID=1465 RepID=UPI0003B19DBA|nr:hypothetical protein [Brevibacillus laterosporus]ERM18964.1 hypothetical protein P615_14390 [Brevibacillus laterosporus PE36]
MTRNIIPAGVNHFHQHNSKSIIDVLSSMEGKNESASTLSEADVHISPMGEKTGCCSYTLPGKLATCSYPALLIGR